MHHMRSEGNFKKNSDGVLTHLEFVCTLAPITYGTSVTAG
jgi:hypothetical protein